MAGVVNTVLLKSDFTGPWSIDRDRAARKKEFRRHRILGRSFEFGINSDDKATNLSITEAYGLRPRSDLRQRAVGFSASADLPQPAAGGLGQ